MTLLQRIKQLVSGTHASAPVQSAAIAVDHPTLGALIPYPDRPDLLVGTIHHQGQSIEVHMSADDAPWDSALMLAETAVSLLCEIDSKCRFLLAAEYLEGYNSDWRFGETMLEDGTTKKFEKPLLTMDAFCASIRLQGISVCGAVTLTLWYDDNDIIWGHGLSVTSFDGVGFGDYHASMAG